MKIRVFSNMCNGVYRIVINTEDWSFGDLELMCQYGEPEIDVGGDFSNPPEAVKSCNGSSGSIYVRVMHGFPYARGFDSRDYGGSIDDAISAGNSWKNEIMGRIANAVNGLRSSTSPSPIPNEEVEVV